MPGSKYERHQINSLEASAAILRDTSLLREIHELEKTAGRDDSEITWEGRAVAREIMSETAVEETRGAYSIFSKVREWLHSIWAITAQVHSAKLKHER